MVRRWLVTAGVLAGVAGAATWLVWQMPPPLLALAIYAAGTSAVVMVLAAALTGGATATRAQEFQPKVGFGTIAHAPARDMAVIACSQEHGFVTADDPLPYGNLPVGSRVRVLPNHACITAAAYDRYYVVDSDFDGGKSVVDVYDRINGW